MVIYIAFSTVVMTLGIIGAVILIRRGGRVREGVNEIGLDVAARSLIRPLPIIYLLVITAVTILVLSL